MVHYNRNTIIHDHCHINTTILRQNAEKSSNSNIPHFIHSLSMFSLTHIGKNGAKISVISNAISNTISFPAWQTYMEDLIKRKYRDRVDALTSVSMEIGML